jgi:CBS domain-containing protein
MRVTAADIMPSLATVVAPTTTLAEIATLLASGQINAVPVCNPDRSLAGIVSKFDLLKPFGETVRAKRDWWLKFVAEGQELPKAFLEYLRRDRRTAADVMVRRVISTDEDATLEELEEMMMQHRIKAIPILRDGRVVGIVSRTDLLVAISKTFESVI